MYETISPGSSTYNPAIAPQGSTIDHLCGDWCACTDPLDPQLCRGVDARWVVEPETITGAG